MAYILRFNLEAEGYTVEIAADGVEALQRIWGSTPDLIILDIMMPRMDGWELLWTIREDSTLGKVPVIILTGKEEDESVARGWLSGIDVYLTKPFDMDDLLLFTRRALQAQANASN